MSIERVARRAARILVLDPEGAVFLQLHDDPEVGLHWVLPGGGLDPGEDELAGALRETVEETGWTDVVPGPALWIWEHDYTRKGVPTRQREVIFLGTGPRRDPLGDLAESFRQDGIMTCRWWTPAELEDCPDVLWPPSLVALMDDLHRNGPPDQPIDLGYTPNPPR